MQPGASTGLGRALEAEMPTWLTAWQERRGPSASPPVVELVVLEGDDAGSQFTLERNELLVGRGSLQGDRTAEIRLEDRSVSRRQAWIRRDASGTWIEHVPSASNPTRVNGVGISRARLSTGDRVEMGHTVIEVRERSGMNLSGLTELLERVVQEGETSRVPQQPSGPDPGSPGRPNPPAASIRPGETRTEIRPVVSVLGELRLMRGIPGMQGQRFPIGLGTTVIGRGDDVDVQIPEPGVSRRHAEIRLAGRSLELVHRSRTNSTRLNGLPVVDRVSLEEGDQIQIADRVVLVVHLDLESGTGVGQAARKRRSGLSGHMEHRLDLERDIEAFNVLGTFLDVDVVESRAMKSGGERPEHIIVSFDRFRSYVSGVCEEFGGQVLNSNGDELMCFFESASSALRAGSAILERLSAFNRDANLLSRDFRFRLGAHTGHSLVDLAAGVAYSEVLDTAGHIQKRAAANTLLISPETAAAVGPGAPLVPEFEPGDDGRVLHRLDRFLTPADRLSDGAELEEVRAQL